MENRYKRAAQLLDKLYEEMPDNAFINESEVRARFKRFQKSFSIERLAAFEGMDILNYIFDLKSQDSLLYTLLYKDGYGEFGSVKGAGVDFYPIYRTNDGGWNTKENGEKKRLSFERAIQVGRTYKNKLVNALRQVDPNRFNTIADYEEFERILKRNIGDDAKYIWIHKYLHMLYPDSFSEFHSWDFKKHFLCVMEIEPKDTFYGMAGQIAEIRRHMKMQDYYRIAWTVYHFFPEVGDGGISRLILTPKAVEKVRSWRPGIKEIIAPSDYDGLANNKWFKSAERNDHNYLFVVSDSDNNLYGTFSGVDALPSGNLNNPIKEKQGIWNPCFKKNDRLPTPEDGINTKDKTFKNSRNLIFIYNRHYNRFSETNDIEDIYNKNRQQYEDEQRAFEVSRKSFISKYPLEIQNVIKMSEKQIVYGFPGSLLTRLYDDFKGHDLVQGLELEDIGSIYRSGDHIWYDNRAFESEKSAFRALQEKLVHFLILCDENRDIDLEEFDTNPLSENLKIKLLSVYSPEKCVGISDPDEIDYILENLGIPFTSQDTTMRKQLLLINWKNTHRPFSLNGVSNYVFLRTICQWLEIPFSHVSNSSSDPFLNKDENNQPENNEGKGEEASNNDSAAQSENGDVRGRESRQSEKAAGKEQTKADDEVILPAADSEVVMENEIEESVDQLKLAAESMHEESDFSYTGAPQEKKPYEETNGRKIIPRDIQKKRNALLHAGYKCEFDGGHKSFISKATGLPYMEAHHLIPMEYYNNFDVSIDVEENIISLCSNCHREIHHGKDASVIVKKLYEQRKPYLQKAGIDISLNQLLVWYNCKHEPM